MRRQLRLPLLIIAAVSNPDEWKDQYQEYCSQLDELNFHRCKSIELTYNESLTDRSIQFYKEGQDLYYVKDWMERRVFKDIIDEFVEYFDIDLDNNMLEGIFEGMSEGDDSEQSQVIEDSVRYDIIQDEEFINTLHELNRNIKLSSDELPEEEELVAPIEFGGRHPSSETAPDEESDQDVEDGYDSEDDNDYGSEDDDDDSVSSSDDYGSGSSRSDTASSRSYSGGTSQSHGSGTSQNYGGTSGRSNVGSSSRSYGSYSGREYGDSS